MSSNATKYKTSTNKKKMKTLNCQAALLTIIKICWLEVKSHANVILLYTIICTIIGI